MNDPRAVPFFSVKRNLTFSVSSLLPAMNENCTLLTPRVDVKNHRADPRSYDAPPGALQLVLDTVFWTVMGIRHVIRFLLSGGQVAPKQPRLTAYRLRSRIWRPNRSMYQSDGRPAARCGFSPDWISRRDPYEYVENDDSTVDHVFAHLR